MEKVSQFVPAARAKRIIAFLIDIAFLGIVGLAIGFAFYNRVTAWGPYGRFFGLVIAIIYFGIGYSGLTGGKTIGKRLTKLQVLKVGDGNLSIIGGMGRAFIVVTPYILNNWWAKEVLQMPVFGLILSIVVIGIGGSIAYTLLFNRKTGQSFHDILFGTIVVANSNEPLAVKQRLPKVHWIFISLFFVIATVSFILSKAFTPPHVKSTMSIMNVLSKNENYLGVSVQDLVMLKQKGPKTRELTVLAWVKQPNQIKKENADQIVSAIRKNLVVTSYDSMRIGFTIGFDLGIAHWSNQQIFSYTQKELESLP